VTSSISATMVERVRQQAFCAHPATQDAGDPILDRCETQDVLLTANLAASGVALLLQVLSAWLALRLSERLQEEEDERQAHEAERARTVRLGLPPTLPRLGQNPVLV
jgi:hypothetical protein